MKRVIITTCGTSLLQSNCWDIEPIKGKHFSEMEDEVEREEHKFNCKTVLKAARDAEVNFSEKFNLLSWENRNYLRDLPAELASLRAIQMYFEAPKMEKLGSDDKIILLHSDNKDGTFCAKRLHEILINNKLIPTVEIELWEIVGLDPKNPKCFGNALKNIWSRCLLEFPIQNTTKYVFNLTAGYKGTAVLLGGFSYHIGRKANIFYLHEETAYKYISITGFDVTKSPFEERFQASYFDLEKNEYFKSPEGPGFIT